MHACCSGAVSRPAFGGAPRRIRRVRGAGFWLAVVLMVGGLWATAIPVALAQGAAPAGPKASPVVAVAALPPGMVGVAYRAQIGLNDGAGAVTFSAKGLPKGLKLAKSSGEITGTPTKAGTFSVVIGAKNADGASAPTTVTVTILALPYWAQGNFAGPATLLTDGEAKAFAGDITGSGILSISGKGKVTGKLLHGGSAYSFAGASLEAIDGDIETLGVRTALKVGRTEIPVVLELQPVQVSGASMLIDGPTICVAEGDGRSADGTLECLMALYRSPWGDAGAADWLRPVIGYYTAGLPADGDVGSGYLSFTVDKKGNVKIAGKLGDGTGISAGSALVFDENEQLWTIVHSAPKAYKGGGFWGQVEFTRDAKGGRTALRPLASPAGAAKQAGLGAPEGLRWVSRSPSATEVYGEGFDYGVDLIGGWYSTVGDLRAYYEDGLEIACADVPVLQVGVKMTDVDWESEREKPPKISWVEEEEVDAANAGPDGMPLSIAVSRGVGKGLEAPKPDKPVTVREDGETSYEYGDVNGDDIDNSSELKLSLARATGLFKGSFTLWYDYTAAIDFTRDEGGEKQAHSKKKVAFQGILTLPNDLSDGGDGFGYFLWSAQGRYDSGRVDRDGEPILKAYKYNRSYGFHLVPR